MEEYGYERVIQNDQVTSGVYRMTVSVAQMPVPGQFYMLRRETYGSGVLLPRAISVADWREGEVDFLYQVVGNGTQEMRDLRRDDVISMMGPLGNGFPVDLLKGNIALVSGGVGVAPMIYTARRLSEKRDCQIHAFAGFQDTPYTVEELERFADTMCITSETGRAGQKGLVTAVFDPGLFDFVLCCGPLPMMRAVTSLCEAAGVTCYLSLENKMACGIGACLVCACRTRDGRSLRACKEGPVFLGGEVDFDAGNLD